ncbi:MAG: P-loop NTPase fold protein, partial [Blastocatellia bacterium]
MPTDISSLLSLIAARMVLAETASTSPYLAMATLIAPELAITPDHVFGNRKRSGLNVKLHFDGHPDIPIETDATVVAHDSKADFAVLKLKSGLRLNLPSQALAGADPPSGASWQSLIITPATPKGEYVTGTVVEPRTIDGIEHLGLLTPRKSESGSSGAPIVVNDRIVGIMARSNHALEDNQWFAIPVSAMLQSKEGDLIRSAMAADISSGAGQASDAVETDAESEMALYRRLGSHALDALSLADGIRARMHRDSVHMEHLIAALFATANGPAQKVMAEARVNRDKIFVILSGHAKQRFPALDGFTPSRLTSLPPLSRHARQALVEARVMANEYKSKEILSRHLLYGALSVTDCDLVKRLLELGLDKNKIEMGRVAAAGGPLIPGYWSDAAKGKDLKDLLGISREVETLCSVLAAKDVKPPLSLGLFGDWGSGKSFFMGEMEKRIKSLKEEAKNDPDSPYCREIVQLWFNAWHYIDTELWASLATEIFDGLAVSLIPQNKKEELDYKRDQLIAREGELEAEKRKQREIERRLVENEKGKTEIETSPRQVIVEAYRFAERQPKAREMARQVEENFNEKIKEAADELGVSTDKVKEQLLEAHGLWRQIRAVWVAMGRVKKSNLWMLYVLAAIVLPATVLALLQSYHPAWQTIITKILT